MSWRTITLGIPIRDSTRSPSCTGRETIWPPDGGASFARRQACTVPARVLATVRSTRPRSTTANTTGTTFGRAVRHTPKPTAATTRAAKSSRPPNDRTTPMVVILLLTLLHFHDESGRFELARVPPRHRDLQRGADQTAVLKRPRRARDRSRFDLHNQASDLHRSSRDLHRSTSDLNSSAAELNRSSRDLNRSAWDMNSSSSDLNRSPSELNRSSSELNSSRSELNSSTPDLFRLILEYSRLLAS